MVQHNTCVCSPTITLRLQVHPSQTNSLLDKYNPLVQGVAIPEVRLRSSHSSHLLASMEDRRDLRGRFRSLKSHVSRTTTIKCATEKLRTSRNTVPTLVISDMVDEAQTAHTVCPYISCQFDYGVELELTLDSHMIFQKLL